jgi:hypothetical protein
MLPIFQAIPGFKAYSIFAGGGGEIFSFSAWETGEAADAANAASAEFVAENLANRVQLQQAITGQILFGTALGVSTKAGVA